MPDGSLFLGSRFPVQTSRVSDTPRLGGSAFLGSRFVVHTSCVSNTPLPGWEFRALRSAGTGRTRGGRKEGGTPTVSLPL